MHRTRPVGGVCELSCWVHNGGMLAPNEPGRDQASLLYVFALASNALLSLVYIALLASPQANWVNPLYALARAAVVYLAQKRRGVFVGLLGLVAGVDVIGLVLFALGWHAILRGEAWRTVLFAGNVIAGLALIAFQIQLQFKKDKTSRSDTA